MTNDPVGMMFPLDLVLRCDQSVVVIESFVQGSILMIQVWKWAVHCRILLLVHTCRTDTDYGPQKCLQCQVGYTDICNWISHYSVSLRPGRRLRSTPLTMKQQGFCSKWTTTDVTRSELVLNET